MKHYIAGPIVGIAAALVMAWLLFSWATLGNADWGIYGIILEAVAILVPLLLANIVLSIVYARRNASRRTFTWMWAPLLLVLVAQMVFDGVQLQKERAIESAHPNIQEVHINLSGRNLWLDPTTNSTDGAAGMPGNDPAKFIVFTRYYGKNEDRMAAYKVARLAESFHEMRVFYGQPLNTPPTTVPVNRPVAFPDVKTFIDHLTFNGGEASIIKYWYYHYQDHIDVVPAISLAESQAMESQSMDLWGTEVPLVEFHIANLGTLPIARLEIDGQAIALGYEAFRPESENSDCSRRNFEAYAVNNLGAPLKVRWQLAQVNPSWHEANVFVPEFSPGKTPITRIRATSVDLYFQEDGSVVAERSQTGELPQQRAIRTTGPAVPLLRKPPCGYAPDRYNENVTVIRN